MSKQVKISKLCLEIGGKKIELTMKQAKELKDVLNDTFGESEVIFRDRWHYPHTYPSNPNYWYTTCSSGTANLAAVGNASTDTAIMNCSEWQGAISGNQITLTAQ